MSSEEDSVRVADEQHEEQLIDDNACPLCYSNVIVFQFHPCQHWVCCYTCLSQIVTKWFTSNQTTHICMFCRTPVQSLYNSEKRTYITPKSLQKKFAKQLEQEEKLREVSDLKLSEEISHARDTEVALGLYEPIDILDEEDNIGELISDDENERSDLVRPIRLENYGGRSSILYNTDSQWQSLYANLTSSLFSLYNNSSNSNSNSIQDEEKRYIMESKLHEINAHLDYVPSEEEENDDNNNNSTSTHTMTTRHRQRIQQQQEQEQENPLETRIQTRSSSRKRQYESHGEDDANEEESINSGNDNQYDDNGEEDENEIEEEGDDN